MNDNSLDLTKILEGCEGITLYFTLYGDCKLGSIGNSSGDDAIRLQDIRTSRPVGILKKNGRKFDTGECLVFPSKVQRDWSKFEKPFKDGKYVVANGRLCIFKSYDEDGYIDVYAAISSDNDPTPNELFVRDPGEITQLVPSAKLRLANSEEVSKMNHILNDNGYEWDPVNKSLKLLRWKPKDNQMYYFIMSVGAYEPSIMSNAWKGIPADMERYKNGNCFPKRDEAEVWMNRFKAATKNISNELKNRKQ